MTSRVSFLRLLAETLRRHIASILITLLVFLIHIITFFLNVQNLLDLKVAEDIKNILSSYYDPVQNNHAYILEEIAELCAPNLANGIIALIIGGFLAFDFLRYMHSKRQTDLYDAMPVRRQKWFLTLFIASLLVFLIPSILTCGLELAIVYGFKLGSTAILKLMLWNLLCTFASFLAGWTVTALAMTLTGHPIIAFLGVGVFCVYVPLILQFLVPTYAYEFFDTYVNDGVRNGFFYFSPATLTYKMMHNYNLWNLKEHWTYLIGAFIFAIIVGLITYWLFVRRPSETAGRAMAFEKINFIIRFLLVIPLALYLGIFLREMSSYNSMLWLLFGVLFGAFLLHGIIECIFQFDIKALISKKRQLLFTFIFCLGFVFVFWADVFHYDSYMPEAKDLKSVQLDTYLFHNGNVDRFEINDSLSDEYIEKALNVIQDIRKSNKPSDDKDYHYVNDFTVTYKLKNGSVKTRSYPYYGDSFPKSLDTLYATKEFKDDYCVLYHLDEIKITSLSISNGLNSKELHLSDKELKTFTETYLKEYTPLTLSEMTTDMYVYEIWLECVDEANDFTISTHYPVFASFSNTLNLIEEYGLSTFAQDANIKLTNLEFWNTKYSENGEMYISDEATLNQLRPHMQLCDFKYRDYYYDDEDYYYCNLRYEINNETRYTNVYIKKSTVDSFLQ